MSKKKAVVEKHDDEWEYEQIAKMNESELLDYVICNPHLLADSYYRGYDKAIYARHDALTAERSKALELAL